MPEHIECNVENRFVLENDGKIALCNACTWYCKLLCIVSSL